MGKCRRLTGTGCVPVSYTHLDVYKRQIQNGTTKLVNIKNQDGITKILDMVPDFVNKFTSKNDVVSEDSAADQTDDAAKSAAGKEMEDILKDSANK